MRPWSFFKGAKALLAFAPLISCTPNSDEVRSQKQAFQHSIMKPWFDLHCATCHATGRSNYLHWHYNPQDYESTFEEHHNEHIYERVYVTKDMPKNEILSHAELEKFRTWADAGYPAK
jgi:hypothetical protein